jgi:thiol-disulfide isomerase/thioredoxin
MKRIILGLVLLGWTGLQAANVSAEMMKNPNKRKTISESFVVPAVEVSNIKGEKVKLAEVTKGKIVVLDVWATWCGPCLMGIPESVKLAKEYKNNPKVVFVYVSIDDDVPAWKKAVETRFEGEGLHYVLPGKWKSPIVSKLPLDGIPFIGVFSSGGKLLANFYNTREVKKIVEHELTK